MHQLRPRCVQIYKNTIYSIYPINTVLEKQGDEADKPDNRDDEAVDFPDRAKSVDVPNKRIEREKRDENNEQTRKSWMVWERRITIKIR